MISRPNTYAVCIFPSIQSNIHNLEQESIKKNQCNQQIAQEFLNLTNREFSLWERLISWKINFQEQIPHLLFQHRLAIDAELAGQWQKADFFWRQVQLEFIEFTKKEENWNQLVLGFSTSSKPSAKLDAIQLRQQFVDEILIDTHCAFYNGHIRQADKLSFDNRGFIHIDYIQDLLNWSGICGKDIRFLLESPLITRINLYKESKKWESAIKVCTQLLRSLPNEIEYQKGLADLHISSTMEKLIDAKSDAQHSKNADILRNGISTVENLLKTYPDHASIFEALGNLYHFRAVSLVNCGQIGEALLSIQKAITYNPYLENACEMRDQLVKSMGKLQAQMHQLNSEMSKQPNAKLTDDEKYLKAQVSQGFGAMNQYIDSKAARVTVFASQIARAIRLWRNMELQEPPKGWQMQFVKGILPDLDNREMMVEAAQGWSKLALKLWYCIGDMWHNPPRSTLEVQAAWATVSAQEIDLAGLDSQLICNFLASQLFGEEQDHALITPPSPDSTPPLFTGISASKKRGAEPFLPWLLSRQDVRIKIQAAVASVLILTAGGLIVREQKASVVRDTAYQNILIASRHQNDLGVVEESETFFAHFPLSDKDGRKQKVMDLYSESLVRWLTQQGDTPTTATQEHLNRYRTVLNTATTQENQQ